MVRLKQTLQYVLAASIQILIRNARYPIFSSGLHEFVVTCVNHFADTARPPTPPIHFRSYHTESFCWTVPITRKSVKKKVDAGLHS